MCFYAQFTQKNLERTLTHTHRNCMTYYILSLEFARPPLSTKDDLVLTTSSSNEYTKLNRRKSTKDTGSNPNNSRFHANRYSVGDFSHLTSQINQYAAHTGSPKGYHIHSYSDGGSGELESLQSIRLVM